jgi:hypothetical protein
MSRRMRYRDLDAIDRSRAQAAGKALAAAVREQRAEQRGSLRDQLVKLGMIVPNSDDPEAA